MLSNAARRPVVDELGPVDAAAEARLVPYKLAGLRPDKWGRLDQNKPPGEAGGPPIYPY
jgi:hypothetical protein